MLLAPRRPGWNPDKTYWLIDACQRLRRNAVDQAES
jgi:hypothetical protein